VPETNASHELLTEMQVGHFNLATVVDDYGAIAGLVPDGGLIGEITDEYDVEEPSSGPTATAPRTLAGASGSTSSSPARHRPPRRRPGHRRWSPVRAARARPAPARPRPVAVTRCGPNSCGPPGDPHQPLRCGPRSTGLSCRWISAPARTAPSRWRRRSPAHSGRGSTPWS
jgi:hypothetical protein